MSAEILCFRMMGSSPKRVLSPGEPDLSKKRRLFAESYDEKLERRHENHLNLIGRNNITTCRRSPRERNVEQNSRQVQFLKRRNLTIDEEEIKQKPSKVTRHRVERRAETATYAAAATAAPEVGLKLSQQKSTAVSQMSPHFLSSSNGTPLANQHSHWGTKNPNFSFHISATVQCDTANKKVSKRDKAIQVPSDTDSELMKKEASQQTDCGIAILDKEIQQLSEYLKEALHRELMLKKKLTLLQQLLATVFQAAEKSWKVQLDDDLANCKLQSLENQLHTWAQNHSRDTVKESMIEMQKQKLKYELVAKETLQRTIKEKMAIEETLASAQRSLSEAEGESVHWKVQCGRAKADCAELTLRHRETTDQLNISDGKLQTAINDNLWLRNLETKLGVVESEKQKLLDQISALKEDKDLIQEQLQTSQAKLQKMEEQKETLASTISSLQEMVKKQAIQTTAQKKVMQQNDLFSARSEHRHQALQQQISELRDQLERQSALLHAKEKECSELHSELTHVQSEHRAWLEKLQLPRDQSKRFQKKPAQRRCCRCVAFLLLGAAITGFAVLWANMDNIPF
ncbi:TRAF3-interacting JNK-activating modulator isoform X1 [Scyliorhinus canicula]|uniref:TRAF3-interacting JNK-activating modulator isoform X1 n=1 Tax=Scyliorhinus canicula TaxID=7830 RepID=UPI0018F4853D|nr:TRAF3-interacting JNK-activating modulator isoform X1 [Scyliorhinus canicula]XP_038676205.1 TRAF3-interacting JNK-activating modulator isoform X1 [Scyliorhinus canicula]